jgi:hypothetical protein
MGMVRFVRHNHKERMLKLAAKPAFTLLLLAGPAFSQTTQFDPPPSFPIHVAAYLTNARIGETTAVMGGFQAELANRSPLYPFVGYLRGGRLLVYEFGVGGEAYLGKARVYSGAAIAFYDINNADAGLRAGVDIPVIKPLGVRLEVRKYGNDNWAYGIAATAPPFRRNRRPASTPPQS